MIPIHKKTASVPIDPNQWINKNKNQIHRRQNLSINKNSSLKTSNLDFFRSRSPKFTSIHIHMNLNQQNTKTPNHKTAQITNPEKKKKSSSTELSDRDVKRSHLSAAKRPLSTSLRYPSVPFPENRLKTNGLDEFKAKIKTYLPQTKKNLKLTPQSIQRR